MKEHDKKKSRFQILQMNLRFSFPVYAKTSQ